MKNLSLNLALTVILCLLFGVSHAEDIETFKLERAFESLADRLVGLGMCQYGERVNVKPFLVRLEKSAIDSEARTALIIKIKNAQKDGYRILKEEAKEEGRELNDYKRYRCFAIIDGKYQEIHRDRREKMQNDPEGFLNEIIRKI